MKRIAVLVAAVLLLTACRAEPTAGEQIVVTALGIDAAESGMRLSVQAIDALRTVGSLAEQETVATAVYTADGASVTEGLQAFLNRAGKRTYILQNRLIAVSEAQCRRQSLFATLDHFIRHREGRALVELAVCRGDPARLLDITTGSNAIPAAYVAEMLAEGRRRGQAVSAYLLDAQRAASGMYDAALPLLSVADGTPQLAGTALFSEGRLCGELSREETVGLTLAAGSATECLFTVEGVTFRLEELTARLSITPLADSWQYSVAVGGRATVAERQGTAVLTADEEAVLRHRLESRVAETVRSALVHTVSECGSDPLGLARRTASRYRTAGVTAATAKAALPRAAFSVSVTLARQ